jgi:hypothetical protein
MKVIWCIIWIICFTQMLPSQPVYNICDYGPNNKNLNYEKILTNYHFTYGCISRM